MSSPKNIQRDSYWLNPDTTDNLTWGNNQAIDIAIPDFNNSGSENIVVGTAHAIAQTSINANQMACIGVLMKQVPGDNTPFRIKASVEDSGMIIVGYADASPTGTNDNINEAYRIPFDKSFDDCVMVPYDSSYETRSLCVAVGSMKQVTSDEVIGCISVQNLGINPPTMQFMVS